MRALDNAVKERLESLALTYEGSGGERRPLPVKYGSPKRDTAPPFVTHYSVDSRPSELVGGFGAQEGRDYEHAFLVVCRKAIEAEEIKEALERALLYSGSRGSGIRLAVEGWEESEPLVWVGDLHDLGDLLGDNTVVPYAGFRVRVSLQRPFGG